MKKILVTYAVNDEYIPIALKGYDLKFVHTGIGKTKSAMNLTEAICIEKPYLVLNIGSAGTLLHAIGDIFVCRRFIDRDFQSVGLPGIEYEIDFEPVLSADKLTENWLSDNQKPGTCNTGDSFVTQAENIDGDVVDMEAYAQAVVCRQFDLPFISVKYVTDIIGQNSVKHWQDKLSDARKGLEKWFNEK